MHGRKRTEYKALQRDPKIVAGLSHKAQQWHAVSTELTRIRRELLLAEERGGTASLASSAANDDAATTTTATAVDEEYTAAAHLPTVAVSTPATAVVDDAHKLLALTEKLLIVNPDPLYLWTYRREVLVLFQDHLERPDDNQNNPRTTALQPSQQPLWLSTELTLTQTALENNPKAYGAWFHRKWCWTRHMGRMQQQHRKLPKNQPKKADTRLWLQHELDLTAQLLHRDERNFHCWNFRRFVVSCLLAFNAAPGMIGVEHGGIENSALLPDGSWNGDNCDDTVWMGAQLVTGPDVLSSSSGTGAAARPLDPVLIRQEWEFTERKIRDNFSNYSAFHYRSKLLPLLLRMLDVGQVDEKPRIDPVSRTWQEVLHQETDLVLQAIFTEPDDQTAWWYWRFLLDFMQQKCQTEQEDVEEKGSTPSLREWYTGLLQQYEAQLEELAAEMPLSKWVHVGLYTIADYWPTGSSPASVSCTEAGDLADQPHGQPPPPQQQRHKKQQLLEKLILLDPDRQGRYQYLLRKLTASSSE